MGDFDGLDGLGDLDGLDWWVTYSIQGHHSHMEQHLRRVARCNIKHCQTIIFSRQETFFKKEEGKKESLCIFYFGAQRRKKVAEMFNFADVASESQSESCAAVVKERERVIPTMMIIMIPILMITMMLIKIKMMMAMMIKGVRG